MPISNEKLNEGGVVKMEKEGVYDVKPTTISVVTGILEQAIVEVGGRASTYDQPTGEESMPQVVRLFNDLCKQDLTAEQGWVLMCLLKLVRSQAGEHKRDNYVDLSAYAAFAGKAAAEERG